MPAISLFCPVCNSSLIQSQSPLPPGQDAEFYNCTRCGPYALSRTMAAGIDGLLRSRGVQSDWARKRTEAVLSYRFRRAQTGGDIQIYTIDAIVRIIERDELPGIAEQIDNFIAWLGDELPEAGQEISFKSDGFVMSVIGAISDAAVHYVVDAAIQSGQVVGDWFLDGSANVTLTVSGWQKYAELKRGHASGLTAFMAMKFGDPDLDAFVDNHLRSAVAATGFKLKRLDDEPRAGLIDDRLRVEIRNCRFLIADLSHGNKGAYWEAGYAEGLGKPVIYTCEKGVFDDLKNPDRPHFDTNHHLTIVWEKENLHDAADSLKATIRATLEDARQQDAEQP